MRLLRLRNPRRAGQVFLRLAGRAGRLHGQLQESLRPSPGAGLRYLLEQGLHRRAVPLHRQGHHQLPHPVLAGHAGRRRLPQAHRGERARLPDRQRAEDVQVPRHLHQGPHLSEHLAPEYLRYYYACKLGRGVDDLDLNLEDFIQKVNSDLVGKVVNIASRCAGFIHKGNGGVLTDANPAPELSDAFTAAFPSIADAYEKRDFSRAMREIMALADKANAWIADKAPWALNKQEGKQDEVQAICSLGINLFRQLIILLKPALPTLAADAEAFLNPPSQQWSDLDSHLGTHQLNAFKPLLTRIEPARVEAMVEASKEDLE